MRLGRKSMYYRNGSKLRPRKGGSFIKVIFSLVVLIVLAAMGCFVYFGWQKADLSSIDGRTQIVAGTTTEAGTDLAKKLENAHTGQYVVTLTEEEVNYYIASKLKMTQGGFLEQVTKTKGVYVDLTKDFIEVFIEREVAQYDDEGVPNTEYIKPFNQTVSIKLKVYTKKQEGGNGTSNVVEIPGGTIGMVPAPRSLVKIVKPGFDALAKFFEEEIELGYEDMVDIKVEDGKLVLDPRALVKSTP